MDNAEVFFPFTVREIANKKIYQKYNWLASRETVVEANEELVRDHELSQDEFNDFILCLPQSKDRNQDGQYIYTDSMLNVSTLNMYRFQRYTQPFPHRNTFYEVLFVHNGTCEIIFDGKHIEVRAGDAVLVSPHVERTIRVNSDDCILFCILVSRTAFEDMFWSVFGEYDIFTNFFLECMNSAQAKRWLIFRKCTEKSIFNMVEYMFFEAQNSAKYREFILIRYLSILFACLLRDESTSIECPGVSDELSGKTVDILKFIERNSEAISLPMLAETFNYSKGHISRLLKDETGMSFIDIRHRSRMTKASNLLISTELSINEIAWEAGYHNVCPFVRIFTRYYNATPGEYRKSRRA